MFGLCPFFVLQILDGISDIRDESDRTGMRVVIEVCFIEHFAALCILKLLNANITSVHILLSNMDE